MADSTYNGWTNYETWSLYTWLTNEEHSSLEWEQRAKRARGDANALAEELKRETFENAPDLGASFYSDMLTAAIGEIDWYEIAEHFIGDSSEESEGEAS
jgi:hypothetical protein